MSVPFLKFAAAGAISAFVLTGCGGGGGGDSGAGGGSVTPPVTSTATFPVDAGYKALIRSGTNDTFDLSGDCMGAATIQTAPATAATATTFEGVSAFASAQTSTASSSNCSVRSPVTGTTYFNAGLVTIGVAVDGGEYSKFAGTPAASLPISAKVFDTGNLSTLTTYTDSTKSTVNGRRELSYKIEADTATTAILNLTTLGYNLGNQLLSTQQSRYRIAADGTLRLYEIDVLFSTTSTLHLVYKVK